MIARMGRLTYESGLIAARMGRLTYEFAASPRRNAREQRVNRGEAGQSSAKMTAYGTSAGLRTPHRRGARSPPHPPVVHRRHGPTQVGRHLPRRARRGLRRGHALRRLGHRRIQPGPGKRRPGQARPEHLRADAVRQGRRVVGADVLRHRRPRPTDPSPSTRVRTST
jgi:hypothetical protein